MLRRSWVLVVTLAVAALLAGCSGSSPRSAPSPTTPTPLAKLDTTAVRLARVDFCDRVAAADVRRALGGAPASDASWSNGDPVPTNHDAGDVAHEYGCTWTGTAGAAAQAWVFARPVSAAFATTLVRQAGRQPGCTAKPASVFGSPAVLQTCTRPGGLERVRRAGLFGDTWLTCEVTGPATAGVEARVDPWCATVVSALDLNG